MGIVAKMPIKNKGSHKRCSIKKVVLNNFAIFTEKHLCWSLFLIDFNKKLQRKYLHVNIAKVLRTPILNNICLRLLLKKISIFNNFYLYFHLLLHISRRTYLISIQLYTIVKQSIQSILKVKKC